MCLIVSERSHKIAVEDVKCYKVVELFNEYEQGKTVGYGLRTFFQDFPISIGKTYKSELDDPYYCMEVEKGLHTFTNFDDAVKFVKGSQYNVLIVSTTIPKGSFYYEGTFKRMFKYFKSYASDTLRYDEIIPMYFEYDDEGHLIEAKNYDEIKNLIK